MVKVTLDPLRNTSEGFGRWFCRGTLASLDITKLAGGQTGVLPEGLAEARPGSTSKGVLQILTWIPEGGKLDGNPCAKKKPKTTEAARVRRI